MKRVVITGLGIISSIGNNRQEVLASLKTGRSGITLATPLQEMNMRSHVWGAVRLDLKDRIDRKMARFMGEASAYAYLAMQEAIEDAGLTEQQISHERIGIIAGTGGGSPANQVAAADAMRARGLRGVGPYMVPRTMTSGITACLATAFKIRGINYTISSACATSAHCIGNAVELIQLGKQDCIFAGGGEELHWTLAMEFDAMGALSTRYNATPEKASRPYDQGRDGFVISGGGGIVLVEELEHARARGAHIYAEIVGYGATSDGYDMVAPSGEGAVRCMRMALQGVDTPIDYINTHGTSTGVGDIKELEAVRTVFGEKAPPISSTKSMTGHALGAAGVHEAAYSLLMLEHGFIAPSINLEQFDEAAAGLDIVIQTRKQRLNTVMSNSFGFGGTNASLVMRQLS
ncbi:MAG: beta-ketoacyl-ACP synthase I [Candidatus Symbiodolus clandestinus]